MITKKTRNTDGNGSPIVCGENCKQLYEFSKAKNILDHLPKNLRRLGFCVEAVSEINPQKKETIEAGAYEMSEKIVEWDNKFKDFEGTFSEAHTRVDELTELLHMNFHDFSSKQVERTIAGLATREYEVRIVEDGEE